VYKVTTPISNGISAHLRYSGKKLLTSLLFSIHILKALDPQTQGSLHTVGAVLGGLSMITDWMNEVLTNYTSETMLLYYNITKLLKELEQPGGDTTVQDIVEKMGSEIDRFNAAWGGNTIKSWVGARLGALSTLTLQQQTHDKKFDVNEFRNRDMTSPAERQRILELLESWKKDAVRKAGTWSTVLWALSTGLGGGSLYLAHTTMFRPEQIDTAIAGMIKTENATPNMMLSTGQTLADTLNKYSADIGGIFGGSKTKELWQYIADTSKNTGKFLEPQISKYAADLPSNLMNILQALSNSFSTPSPVTILTEGGGHLWQMSLAKVHVAAVSVSSGLHIIKSATGVVKAYTSAYDAIKDTLGEKGLYG
jgi:hypothetical protein